MGLSVVMTRPASEAPRKAMAYSGLGEEDYFQDPPSSSYLLGITIASTSPDCAPNLSNPLPKHLSNDNDKNKDNRNTM